MLKRHSRHFVSTKVTASDRFRWVFWGGWIIDHEINPMVAFPWDYYIYLLIYHKNQSNVGKYTIPMDPMGMWNHKGW